MARFPTTGLALVPRSRSGHVGTDGGGYQYRLCPASEALTEECFMRMPLEFNRSMQQLRWNNGSRLSIQGTWVDTGTNPIGSTWAR